jgi:thymidylate synthase (FAD)
MPMSVRPIAWTHFEPPADVPWSTDTDGGQALAEFAGRACYQSWSKPNPATATNAGYIRHIIEVGHLSVLEHGTVTVYMTDVARSFTHELVRHRHFSYSQLSQRYVPAAKTGVVEPDIIAGDPHMHRVFTETMEHIDEGYRQLLHALERTTAAAAGSTGQRKAARQAARAVLPNATETRIVVTGNYRAWRHFIAMRATVEADVEMRAVAVACLRALRPIAPNVFADFTVRALHDGTEVVDVGWPA